MVVVRQLYPPKSSRFTVRSCLLQFVHPLIVCCCLLAINATTSCRGVTTAFQQRHHHHHGSFILRNNKNKNNFNKRSSISISSSSFQSSSFIISPFSTSSASSHVPPFTTSLSMSDRTVPAKSDHDDIASKSSPFSTVSSASSSSSSSSSSSMEYFTSQVGGSVSSLSPSSSSEPLPEQQQQQQERQRRRIVNGTVLSSLVLVTLYLLTHSQLEALVALWEYDLGDIPAADGSESVTKTSVATQVLVRLPLDALHSYEQLVPRNPVFYKACTSGVAYGLGDFTSQVVQGKPLEDIDLPRSARSGAAGFIGHGPLCHYWLIFMETYLDFGGAWWATGIKVTADLTVWSIFLCASYSFLIGMFELRDPRDVWKDVQATTWPALRSAWRFWPFVHTISFSHAVPMDLKLLWVDTMEIVWVTILSKVANEDKNLARAQQEEEAAEVACATTLQDQFVVVTSSSMKKQNDNDDGERVLEALTNPNNDSSETDDVSMRVLAACWPLVAMWPVLYAGYQIEKILGLEV